MKQRHFPRSLHCRNSVLCMLPIAFRSRPLSQWPTHLRNFIEFLCQVDRINHQDHGFVLFQKHLHKHRQPSSVSQTSCSHYATTYSFARNCPGASMIGILSEGFLRPSDWTNTETHPSLGFYCRCCYQGHGHEDGSIDDSSRLSFEYQRALHTPCKYGGRRSQTRPYFVTGECLSRVHAHCVVWQGGVFADSVASHFYDVVGGRYKCRSSVSRLVYAGAFVDPEELRTLNIDLDHAGPET